MLKFGLLKKSTYFSSSSITCSQMIDEIYEFAMKIGRLTGAGLFDRNYTLLNRRATLMIFILITGCFLTVYDMYKFYEDSYRFMFCCLLCSGQMQSFIKIYSFGFRRKDFFELRKQAEKFHENFQSTHLSKMFEEKLMQVTHVCAILTFLYLSSYVLISVFPIGFYLITGKRILHVGIELPFIDWEESYVGYAANFAHQLLAISGFVCLANTILIIQVVLVGCALHQFKVLEIILNDLDEMLNEQNLPKVTKQLKVLHQTHLSLMEFLVKLESLFAPYYFVELAALIFQKVVVLYALINVSCLFN